MCDTVWLCVTIYTAVVGRLKRILQSAQWWVWTSKQLISNFSWRWCREISRFPCCTRTMLIGTVSHAWHLQYYPTNTARIDERIWSLLQRFLRAYMSGLSIPPWRWNVLQPRRYRLFSLLLARSCLSLLHTSLRDLCCLLRTFCVRIFLLWWYARKDGQKFTGSQCSLSGLRSAFFLSSHVGVVSVLCHSRLVLWWGRLRHKVSREYNLGLLRWHSPLTTCRLRVQGQSDWLWSKIDFLVSCFLFCTLLRMHSILHIDLGLQW